MTTDPRPLLPHDEDAELLVLGALLYGVPLDIQEEDFFGERHRRLFRAVRYEQARGEAVEVGLVRRRLDQQDPKAGLLIFDAMESFTTREGAVRTAKAVREDAQRRRLIEDLNKASELASGRADMGQLREAVAFLGLDSEVAETREPLDLPALLRDGVRPIPYLIDPWVPEGARVLMAGAAETGKSLLAMAWTADLTHQGKRVVYIDGENPMSELLRRWSRLSPDLSHLEVFTEALDLADPTDARFLLDVAQGASLVVVDTLSACWSGDENSNAEIAGLDRTVLQPLSRSGAAVLVLDHVGHAVPFVKRKGVSAPRGASAKGQKFDVVLELQAGSDAFTLEHAKARLGGRKAMPAFKAIDTPEGGLTVAQAEPPADSKVRDLAHAMVDAIETEAPLSTKRLREMVGGGKANQDAAMLLLESEDPPRVQVAEETIETGRGRQHARAWRPAERVSEGVPRVSGTTSEGMGRRVSPGVSIGDPGYPDPPLDEKSQGYPRPVEDAVALLTAQLGAIEVGS